MRLRWSERALALALMLSASMAGAQQRSATPSGGRIPAGFRSLDDQFWEGPWVFATGRATALSRWHNRSLTGSGPIPIRLDDGSTGTLSVAAGPCPDPSVCAGPRDDCGCFENDSFWIDVVDATSRTVAHLHLWAAYGSFDVVPIDLLDGPGDELVVVRMPQHASPPPGRDLKIWKLAPTRPIELFDNANFRVADRLWTIEGAVPCASWRTRLVVDPTSPKPRSIALRADFAAEDRLDSGCHLSTEGAEQTAALEGIRALRFQNGKYRLQPQ